ncbi:MAG: RsfS/YbeB/iojap family protein, partial [Prevotella sp.]
SQWVAIDYIDVIVHIFLPETRSYYAIEDLWEDAEQTSLPNID